MKNFDIKCLLLAAAVTAIKSEFEDHCEWLRRKRANKKYDDDNKALVCISSLSPFRFCLEAKGARRSCWQLHTNPQKPSNLCVFILQCHNISNSKQAAN